VTARPVSVVDLADVRAEAAKRERPRWVGAARPSVRDVLCGTGEETTWKPVHDGDRAPVQSSAVADAAGECMSLMRALAVRAVC